MGKLKEVAASKKSSSVTVSTRSEEKRTSKPPAGAEIISKSVTTSTEQITNGWLVTKSYSVDYKDKTKDYTQYAYWDEKTYFKDDPALGFKEADLAAAFE